MQNKMKGNQKTIYIYKYILLIHINVYVYSRYATCISMLLGGDRSWVAFVGIGISIGIGVSVSVLLLLLLLL